MNKVKAFLKRYCFFILMLSISFVILTVSPKTGGKVFQLTGNNLLEMASVLPLIFVLLGLLDVWVEREIMVRYMGEGSGLKGALLGFLLGSTAVGSLYAAFPIAVVLLKKGAKRSNVFLFIGAWATTKLLLLLLLQEGFHDIVLRIARKSCGAVLLVHIENLVPDQVRLLLKRLAHYTKGLAIAPPVVGCRPSRP